MESSKKILLTTIGIAVLIVTIVGVTYAFFNYTRTGSNNVIKVGRISFNTNQTDTINLENIFPIDRSDASTNTEYTDEVVITITGDTTYNDGIEYVVKAVDVNNLVNGKELPISLITTVDGIGDEDTDYFDNRDNFTTSKYTIISHNTLENDDDLVIGYIAKGSTGINGTITIKAFIDKDRIAISDTYPEGERYETIGQDTYEVKANLSESELKSCIHNVAYLDPSVQGAYTINNNPNENAINSCITYFSDMNIPLESGESFDSFCRNNGTISGTTLQEVVNYGAYNLELINMGILEITYTNTETVEAFCRGTGTINNQTFQQMLDSGNFSQYTIDGLKNGNVIIQTSYQITNSWTEGTTNAWVNNRTVFTTEEWNNMSSNGVSFKIKVEANEGIWVGDPSNLYNIMTKNAVIDNISSTYVTSSSGIDFSKLYGDTDNDGIIDNGKGVYLRAGTENDANPIYYYRGAVEDNNVYFGNYCW